jgi:hypothetical protein
MNSRTAALAATAVFAAALAGCSGTSNAVSQPPAPAATSAAPAPAAAPASTPAQDVAAFGGAVTFPEGVKVTVSQPTAVKAAEFAAGAVEGKIVVLNLSVTNGSGKPLDGTMLSYPKVSYGASGAQAQNAFDSSAGLGAGMLSTILPGETQTVKLGFGIPAAGFSAVRVEVSGPSFDDQPAVFKGAVK